MIRVAGAEAGTRGSASFVIDTRDVIVDADLVFGGRERPCCGRRARPCRPAGTQPLSRSPPRWRARRTSRPRRALFVVDGSRSMELVGRQNTTQVNPRDRVGAAGGPR